METKHNITDFIKAKEKPQVDENYFSNFEEILLQKIKNETSTIKVVERIIQIERKSIFLKPAFWFSSIAASLTIVFGISYFNANKIDFSKISEKEIIAYVEKNDSDVLVEEVKEISTPIINKQEKDEVTKAKTQLAREIETYEINTQNQTFDELMNSFSDEDLYLYLNSDEVEFDESELL